MANESQSTDPDNLYSGVSSAEPVVPTFGNEEKPKSVQGEIDKHKQLGSMLTDPLTEAVVAKIEAERAKLKDVHGYIDMIRNASAKDKEKIFDEFRSRELSLAFIDDFEQWILSLIKTHQQNPNG